MQPSIFNCPLSRMFRLSSVVLLSAMCGMAASEEDLIDKVYSVVTNINRYIAANSMDRLALPDFTDNGPLHELKIKNSYVGNFSTAEVKEVPFVNVTTVEGSKMYTFGVVLGLNPAEITYDFDLTIEGFFPMSGKAKVVAYTNTYEVRGLVLANPNGSCHALLVKCKFRDLKNFKVDMKPKSVSYISKVKTYVLDTVTPHYIPNINEGLEGLIQKSQFKTVFSSIVCKNAKLISR